MLLVVKLLIKVLKIYIKYKKSKQNIGYCAYLLNIIKNNIYNKYIKNQIYTKINVRKKVKKDE